MSIRLYLSLPAIHVPETHHLLLCPEVHDPEEGQLLLCERLEVDSLRGRGEYDAQARSAQLVLYFSQIVEEAENVS